MKLPLHTTLSETIKQSCLSLFQRSNTFRQWLFRTSFYVRLMLFKLYWCNYTKIDVIHLFNYSLLNICWNVYFRLHLLKVVLKSDSMHWMQILELQKTLLLLKHLIICCRQSGIKYLN